MLVASPAPTIASTIVPITIRYTIEWIRNANPTIATLPSSGSSDVAHPLPPSGGLGGATSSTGAGAGGWGQDLSGRWIRKTAVQLTGESARLTGVTGVPVVSSPGTIGLR